jgi:hypothetical protein
MAAQLPNRNSSWNVATVLNQAALQFQLLVNTIVSYWAKRGSLYKPLIVPIRYQAAPSAEWHSHTCLTISTKVQCGEIILDYRRCEGGLPVFEISSLRGKANLVQFDVVYSESFKGLNNEEGEQ